MQWMWARLLTVILAVVLNACVSQSTNPYNNNTAAKARAKAHTDLGAAYYQQGKYEIALDEFNVAIKNDASYALAYNGLGLVHSALGENDKADLAFQKALQLEPQSSESHNNYGNFLCNTGHYAESIKHF